MKHSEEQARGQGGKETAGSRGKRKLSSRKGTATIPADVSQQQHTIKDLFTRSIDKSGLTGDTSPTNKRHKKEHQSLHDSPSKQHGVMAANKMYEFANTQRNGLIDLTTSPPASPRRKSTGKNGVSPISSFTPQTGARKIVVKNLRTTPRLNHDDYFKKVWTQLDSALTAILTHGKLAHSLEELYKGVENLCRQDKAQVLYQRLCERCKTHIESSVQQELLQQAKLAANDAELLKAVGQAWSTWSDQLVWTSASAFEIARH